MHSNSYYKGFNDGEYDAMSSSGYDPEYGVAEADSLPEYQEGYETGYETGIAKRKS